MSLNLILILKYIVALPYNVVSSVRNWFDVLQFMNTEALITYFGKLFFCSLGNTIFNIFSVFYCIFNFIIYHTNCVNLASISLFVISVLACFSNALNC